MERSASGQATRRHLGTWWHSIPAAEVIGPTVVVGLAYLVVLALYPIFRDYQSPLDFVHIGQYYCCGGASESIGYDGQYYYYMATDPLHAGTHMDNAPFRYQRILFSVVVWALSLGGRPELVPWWLLIVNVLGTLAGTTALAVLLRRRGFSPWFSLAFGLYFGQFASITHDVPDGLAAGLIVFAWLAMDRGRWKEAAFWLAIAGLTRETTLIFAAAAALDALFQRHIGRTLLMLATALPFILWVIFLHYAFGTTGLFFSTVVSKAPKIPLAGFIGIAKLSPLFFINLLFIVIPGLLALVWVASEIVTKKWRASPGLLFAILVTTIWLVLFLNSFTYGDLASSTRITIGLPLGWLLYAAVRRWQRLLQWATPWALGVVFYSLGVVIPLQSIIP